ncbi:glycosyl transferase [Clostridium sp. Bc-iso-3]|nr:glycosyl transferase [Clostridium sp. Bc-iso-3]
MKTLFEACKPRESVFDETKRDDTLDLSNLLDGSIDGKQFFEETFITEGMELLFDTAFKRFEGKASSGLVKLTQAMGGGKTHNMVALGVLAKNKEIRKSILNGKYANVDSDIRVVAYTGRESYLEFGIWGEIAEQLGKKELFNTFYTPLMAPGQSAWINLLKSDTPTLILLDELPPYLQNAKTIPVGTGTVADITTTALANLFNAVGKAELHNVCIVVSDLQATYEEGSQLLQKSFKELENEIERSAINIEPVGANTDDLYNILRTRLFEKVGKKEDIDKIAMEYRRAVVEARQMGYTNYSPEEIVKGIYTSYPFHPSVKDLFARFKENPGFQQTRGFIRLTRMMVRDLYSDDKKAKNRYLINAFDINLNDKEIMPMVKSIKPRLSNAISHDIANQGKSVAEIMDEQAKSTDMEDLSKLILVSSLANVTNAIIGLSIQELIGYMAEPARDITRLKSALEEYKVKAWYLYTDKNERLFFKDIKNVNAELLDLVNTYSYEVAKQKIKDILKDKFRPKLSDCYQEVLVFPSIEEIELKKDKITLILTEPYPGNKGLNPGIEKFFEDTTYKNRVMFLSGQRSSMEGLINIAKQYKAMETIIYRMSNEEKLPENDPQYQQALDLFDKVNLQLLQATRETFVTLHYPKRKGLANDDFEMKFNENNYDVEDQIRDLLIKVMKFTKQTDTEEFRGMFEDRIFTQRQMTWNNLKERVATITAWPWHNPRALEDLRDDMLRKGIWIETGGYLDKEPPAPETSVFVREIGEDKNTGEVTLKIQPHNGDMVHYEINGDATEASMVVEDIHNFKTKELKLSFLCVDSTGKNTTGPVEYWTRKINLQHKIYDKDGKSNVELKATSPNVTIRYTTDGSNPKESGGVYEESFIIPEGTKFIQAIAVNESLGVYSDVMQIEVKEKKFEIDKEKPVHLIEPIVSNNTTETFNVVEKLSKYDLSVSGVTIGITEKGSGSNTGFIELTMGDFYIKKPENLVEELKGLIDKFFDDKSFETHITINKVIFDSGQVFEEWVSDNKEIIEQYKNKILQ